MSGLKNLENSLKRKMELNDYKPENRQTSKEISQQVKHKVTFYLTEEELKKFDRIYGQRIIEGNKIDRSALICEMIRQYSEKEYDR